MFCSTTRLIERCHLLYIFITVAILLLLFCIYLYKKHSNRMRDEDKKIENEEIISREQIEMSVEELPEVLESADGEPGLIRNPLENEEENENIKENDKESKTEVIIETIDESNGQIMDTSVKE